MAVKMLSNQTLRTKKGRKYTKIVVRSDKPVVGSPRKKEKLKKHA
ncbi:hypothetical protein DNHGIG_00530 [Collibacillus ludicampi]|uniref:Uncharacterized protein n=1 Tax=Collibacillus ludicampi TaxID=2771369 RepID=A0AAV4L9M1_9BACL|nr:hypothetical protein [Collibacillus ludicampi]GIM44504.1 hypothetical protein DNHGIG_00530 [Collibacillus ludicampi]